MWSVNASTEDEQSRYLQLDPPEVRVNQDLTPTHNPMIVSGSGNATTLPTLLVHALLPLVDELAPYVHSDNDFQPGKFGTKLKTHAWKRTA